jgi:hypothetical protein
VLNLIIVVFLFAVAGGSLATTFAPGIQWWSLAIALTSTFCAMIWTFLNLLNLRSIRRGPFQWKVSKSAAKRAIDEEESLSAEEEEMPIIASGKF